MIRTFQLLAVVAATLIATYTGGWESLADEWQPAQTESFIASYDPTAVPVEASQIFLDSNVFRPVELPGILSLVRQASWPAPALDAGQQATHDRTIRLPPAEMWPDQSESVPNIEWVDGGLNIDSESSSIASAPTAGPLLMSPETAEAPLLPPKSTDSVTPGLANSVAGDLDPEALPELIQEFPHTEFELPVRSILAARFGWWSVDQKGNPAKVGEFQSLDPSPFFDVDGLLTNGLQTWNFHGSILDNDSSSTGGNYFGPLLSARWDYERYLRRLDRDPLDAFVDFDQQPPLPLPGPPANFRDMKEDLAVGEDFAIRVQQLDASFKGKLTRNINWRLNVWGMRKHGERQATAMAHCYTAPNATDTNGNPVTGVACHILSQRQRIDWLTAEIEPVLEGRFGPVVAEYSRTVRALATDDQFVTRPYDGFGLVGDQPYNLVPENLTEIDRLKFGVTLPERRDAYARFYNGNTRNDFRNTNRRFHGMDLRVSDRSVEGITVTAYAKTYTQTGQFPNFLLPFEDAADIRFPINYDRTTAGIDGSWRPFHDEWSARRHLRFSWGYEYRELDRENALFGQNAFAVNQSSTRTNNIHLRGDMRWSPKLDSYARYRLTFVDDPLFAIADNGTTNTNLPTQTHRVEVGSTWSPTYSFLLTGLVGLDYGWNSSNVANFQEDNYDLVFTAWYAPTPRWSISGGLAFYRNWIDQDITLGGSSTPLTLPWEYGGRSNVVNLGTTYAWTKRMILSGTLDFVHGDNIFDQLARWPDLPFYSDVEVKTTRFMAGVDYDLGHCMYCYVRYQLFDYDDEAAFFDGGRSEMLLIGGTAVF